MSDTTPTPINVTTVAVDDGYAYTKVAWMDEAAAKIRTSRVPSRAREGLHVMTSIEGTPEGGYETHGAQYSVGNHQNPIDTRNDEYPFSEMNRVIIHHALRQAGFAQDAEQKIEILGLTIPFSRFYQEPGLSARRAESIGKTVIAIGNKPELTLPGDESGVKVFPEAAAAWVDWMLDDQGQDAGDPSDPIAIVDVGGRTTDVAVMPHGEGQIDQSLSGTDKIGVMDVVVDIQGRISRKFNVDCPYTEAEKAMDRGYVSIFGERHDVQDLVKEAKHKVSAQIYEVVQERVSKSAPFLKRFLFVGGGASVLKDMLSQYPNVEVPHEPEYANARGVLKYLLYWKAE